MLVNRMQSTVRFCMAMDLLADGRLVVMALMEKRGFRCAAQWSSQTHCAALRLGGYPLVDGASLPCALWTLAGSKVESASADERGGCVPSSGFAAAAVCFAEVMNEWSDTAFAWGRAFAAIRTRNAMADIDIRASRK